MANKNVIVARSQAVGSFVARIENVMLYVNFLFLTYLTVINCFDTGLRWVGAHKQVTLIILAYLASFSQEAIFQLSFFIDISRHFF